MNGVYEISSYLFQKDERNVACTMYTYLYIVRLIKVQLLVCVLINRRLLPTSCFVRYHANLFRRLGKSWSVLPARKRKMVGLLCTARAIFILSFCLSLVEARTLLLAHVVREL